MNEELHDQLKQTQDREVFVYEDKEHYSSMLDNLNMLRKNRQFCDVILQVGGSTGEIHEIYAHKVVLSSASPYLLEMFSNDTINSNGASVPAAGALPQQYRLVPNGLSNTHANHGITSVNVLKGHQGPIEFDPEAFEQIIDYAYTSQLRVPAEKVREIYAIASRLKMTTVAYKCGQFLLSTLTPDNCLEVRSMKTVLKDPYLLQSVDGYIKQNFEKIVTERQAQMEGPRADENGLLRCKIEFLLNTEQEQASINERHMFNEVLDWIRNSFAEETLDLGTLVERKLIMLYYNKTLNQIQDCSEMSYTDSLIESRSPEEAEIIEDYKKLSKRLSTPNLKSSSSVDNLTTPATAVPTNSNGKAIVSDKSSVPSKPRQFLFTRSDSDSSLSSIADNDDEQDWKVLANCHIGKNTLAGLVTIAGQLCLLTLKLRARHMSKGAGSLADGTEEATMASTLDNYCLIPPMSSARCAVGTAELGGKLFVCGGYDRGECLKTVEVYDTVNNKWETLQHMQVPRGRFAIAVVQNKVYAIGGCDGQNELNSAEFYDSLTLDWKQIQSAPVVRSNAGVCAMGSKIYVIGGWNGTRGMTRCDVYDPVECKWSEFGHLNTGRYQTAVCTMNDVIYAVGGCDSWSCLNSVEAFQNGVWKMIAPLQTARRGCGVAAYDGKLYAVGGHDGVHALCSVEVYDSIENRWTFGKPLTSARANVGVAVVGNRLYAVGGFNGKTFLNTIEYFDFESQEWTTSVPIVSNGSNSSSHNGDNNNNKGGDDHQQHQGNNYYSNNNNNSDQQQHSTFSSSSNDNNNKIDGGEIDTTEQSSSPPSSGISQMKSLSGKVSQLKHSLSSEPLVEVEETIVGH